MTLSCSGHLSRIEAMLLPSHCCKASHAGTSTLGGVGTSAPAFIRSTFKVNKWSSRIFEVCIDCTSYESSHITLQPQLKINVQDIVLLKFYITLYILLTLFLQGCNFKLRG